jgi:uncharacterized protein YcaQ
MTKLTLTEARKLTVAGQLLDAPQPRSMLETVDWLGGLQMDPTSAVARKRAARALEPARQLRPR